MPASWPWLVLVLALIAVALLIYLAFLVWRAQKNADTDPIGPPPLQAGQAEPEETEEEAEAVDMRRIFRRAMKRLRTYLPGRQARYGLPWFVLLGAEDSRPVDLLADVGLPLPFGPPEDLSEGSERCNFWFFNEGLFIDLGGAYVDRGGAENELGWRKFLRLLQQHRPERPIDGVVLTIDAVQLMRAREAGASSEVERRAAAFYRQLWQMQRQLGIRLSVSVLVTGCDELPGFGAFVDGLPEVMRGEILGWSSPYGVEQPYQTDWPAQAFAAVDERLRQARSAIFAQPDVAGDADGVFLLPVALRGLEPPLATLLEQVFRPSAYHDPMILRGIYFTGREESQTPALPPRSHFLRDLLQAKIFPEGDLASPTERTLWTRNRRVRLLQAGLLALALVLLLGSIIAYGRLGRNRDPLIHYLTQSEDNVLTLRAGQPSAQEMRQWSLRLVRDLTRINLGSFSSPFLPSSWFSHLRRDLESAIIESYDDVIFVAMHDEMHRRLEGLLSMARLAQGRFTATGSPDPRPTASGDLPVPAVSELPEYGALRELSRGLQQLETHARYYNTLPQSQDLEHFARLVEYLFDEEVPEDFFENAGLYQAALARVTPVPFDAKSYAPTVSAEVLRLGDRFYQRLIRDAELGRHLGRLSDTLQALVRWGWESENEADRLRGVVKTLQQVEVALSRTEVEWAFRDSFDLGDDFDAVVSHLENSGFVEDESLERLLKNGEQDWLFFRSQLLAYRSDLTGPFLDREQDQPLMQFSSETLLLKATLESFLGQSFVELDPALTLRTEIPPGQRLQWSTQLLTQAVALRPSYERFVSQRLSRFPDELRLGLEAVARNRLDDRITGYLSRAQRFDAVPEASTVLFLERRLASDIAAFEAASEPLGSLMALYQDLGLWKSQQQLGDLVAEQAVGLLQAVDTLLADEGLYRPRGGDFSWWNGDGDPMLAGFEAADQEELQAYLDIQRDRIRQLALDFAKPLVVWLGEDGVQRVPGHRSLVLKWDRILRQLDGHEKSRAGNSITALDSLLQGTLSEVRLTSCDSLDKVERDTGAGDFFSARRDSLKRSLGDRCQELVEVRAAREYRRLATFFDRRLAGRYPFATSTPEPYVEETDPDDLRAFFDRFDRHLPLLQAVHDDSKAFGDVLPDVRTFIGRLVAIRGFFASFLDPPEDSTEPPAEPAFDLEPTFRINRGREVGGNQVLGWRLSIGDSSVDPRSESRRLRWGPGDRVRLTLDWAKDSPRVPWLPLARRGVRLVGDRQLTYETSNLWSVLAFVEAHRSPPSGLPSFVDIRPHTLRFEVDTWPLAALEENGAPPEGEEPETTRVFIRLAVMAPDATEPLEVPVFPSAAPRLPKPDADGSEVSP